MSDDMPVESDTPPDHIVIGLKLDADTLPGWWEELVALAPRFVRRMAVVERPDFWYVKAEVHKDLAEDFHAAVAEAWEAWQAEQGG